MYLLPTIYSIILQLFRVLEYYFDSPQRKRSTRTRYARFELKINFEWKFALLQIGHDLLFLLLELLLGERTAFA